MQQPPRVVVHVVAAEDWQALEALHRMAPVLAAAGATQQVLAIDEQRTAADCSAWSREVPVEVAPLRFAGLTLRGKIRALGRALSAAAQTLYAVHLHGMRACLLGAYALRASALRARVICSPHGAPLHSPWRAALLARLLQIKLAPLDFATLSASLAEAGPLSRLLRRSVDVVLYPLSEVFFSTRRDEDKRAHVIASGGGQEVVDLVTRLAVLFNGREPRVRFSWLGPALVGGAGALAAAGVQVIAAPDEAARAQALSQAWLFIDVSVEDEMPLGTAQAMAAGVPCLVSDTAAHRELIRHGETGFICASERDYLDRLVLLLRDRDECARLGEAARAEARRRLTQEQFERAVLRAYAIPGSALQAVPAGPPLRLVSGGT